LWLKLPGFVFPISGDRRALRAPLPGNSLMPRGAKIAAQQTVIVSDRRSREPNDPDQAKPYRYWLNAIC
jgi:hypothetical protein